MRVYFFQVFWVGRIGRSSNLFVLLILLVLRALRRIETTLTLRCLWGWRRIRNGPDQQRKLLDEWLRPRHYVRVDVNAHTILEAVRVRCDHLRLLEPLVQPVNRPVQLHLEWEIEKYSASNHFFFPLSSENTF